MCAVEFPGGKVQEVRGGYFPHVTVIEQETRARFLDGVSREASYSPVGECRPGQTAVAHVWLYTYRSGIEKFSWADCRLEKVAELELLLEKAGVGR